MGSLDPPIAGGVSQDMVSLAHVVGAGAVNAPALGVNTMQGSYCVFARNVTVRRLWARVVAAAGAGGLFRFGLYQVVTPGVISTAARIFDSGDFASDVAATNRVTADNLGLAIPAGVGVWVTFLFGVSVAGLTMQGIAPAAARVGMAPGAAGDEGGQKPFILGTLAYGALPATLGGFAGLSSVTNNCPILTANFSA